MMRRTYFLSKEERFMKIVLFDVKSYDKKHFEAANKDFG